MKRSRKLNILILLFLIVTVFYPLFLMLLNVEWIEFSELIKSVAFKDSFFNSIFVTMIGTLISLFLAFLLAYGLNMANIKHREFFKILIVLPMLIPSISHGLALINLFGSNGLIGNFDIIGAKGIILGSVLYSFPVAFLIFNDGFNYIDNTLYDTALILGLNKWQMFKKITLCYLKKPILSAFFAVFTMIFTDYGVPLSVGGKFLTLPVFLYKEVIGLLDFSKGTMIGLFLLIPAIISFLIDTFLKNYSNENINSKAKISINKKRDIIFSILIYAILICIVAILGSFICYAFINNFRLDRSFSLIHFKYVFEDDLFTYLFNSIFISLMVAIIGTIVAYFSAYVTARVGGKNSKIIHILAMSSLAIPGIVLGLGYMISFKDTFIYNTFIILIVVNIIHFFASPYLMAYNALLKVDSNYELVAKTFNISSFRIIKDVIIPCTKKTIREMVSYFFVNSMITISAVSFLFNTKNMPLSLLINNYEGSMMLGEAAIVSLIILIINIIVKFIVYLLNRKELRNERNVNI